MKYNVTLCLEIEAPHPVEAVRRFGQGLYFPDIKDDAGEPYGALGLEVCPLDSDGETQAVYYYLLNSSGLIEEDIP